jgi:RNA polymerase sigma-70 factor, ECF subfamily
MKVSRPSLHFQDVRLVSAAQSEASRAGTTTPDQAHAPLDFAAVYDRHFADILRWARALGAPESEWEDLAQEVFVIVRRKLDDFDGGNLAGWLYTITKLTVRDHGRRAWFRRIFRGSEPFEFDRQASVTVDPEQAFEAREKRRLFYRLVAGMSRTLRETFLLYEVEGYSGDEIASFQNIPIGTVWTRLHHARKEFVSRVKAQMRVDEAKERR